MKALYSFIAIAIAVTSSAFAQQETSTSNRIAINNFLVKEHLLKNEKIAIVASDEEEKPMENVNGVFQFSINGFSQELKFNDGIAVAPQPITESTFIYLRHKNEEGTHGKLFYVLKTGDTLKPIRISWVMLAIIPVVVLIAMAFRKLLIYAVIILIGIFVFNSSNGLSFPTFFDTIFDGLKSFF
ncbi:MAG TPA: hypothetical protein VGE26_06725 [Sphingobacteriaceae bacterium]